MVFDIKGKVALVTGGASGIGFRYAKELLRKGAKGVTLADVDPVVAEKALAEIQKEFGPGRAVFAKTDVTDIQQFEDAFKKTVETFKNIDILINNAGILNDNIWQKQIAINVNGVVHGILLGIENYLPKYKQGSEAVIVNMSSVAGLGSSDEGAFPGIPIYAGTKAAVAAMTRAWGEPHHYKRTNVKLFAICPGATITPLLTDITGRNLGPAYEDLLALQSFPTQEPEFVAEQVVKLIETSPNGAIWVVESGEPPYQYIFPERESFKNP